MENGKTDREMGKAAEGQREKEWEKREMERGKGKDRKGKKEKEREKGKVGKEKREMKEGKGVRGIVYPYLWSVIKQMDCARA